MAGKRTTTSTDSKTGSAGMATNKTMTGRTFPPTGKGRVGGAKPGKPC